MFALAGCGGAPVQSEAPSIKYHNNIAYIDLPGVRCPDPSYGEVACIAFAPSIYRPIGDEYARAHELDHLDGMAHGPWFYLGTVPCAKVLFGGNTKWKIGDLMCRTADGQYAKGTP